MDNLDAAGHTGGSEELLLNKENSQKKIRDIHYINSLFDNLLNLLSDDTFLVRNSNGDSYSVSFDIENNILEIDNITYNSFFIELKINSGAQNSNYYYSFSMYYNNTQSNWKNHITSCIDSYIPFEISMNSDRDIESYVYSLICQQIESVNSSIKDNSSSFDKREISNYSDSSDSDSPDSDSSDDLYSYTNFDSFTDFDFDSYTDFDIDSSNDLESYGNLNSSNDSDRSTPSTQFDSSKYRHLWVRCEDCYGLNYKKFFRSRMSICEYCGSHLKMSSSDRIEFFIDPGTWEPIDENMASMDPIEFHSEDDPYIDRINFYQKETDLTEAVQTGVGKLEGITVAIGIMDFRFMGGSMGSVVGEKITRLIEYATNKFIPIIIVCASGGARMQEGSLSLMQMAKISSASYEYDYQSKKKLLYISILTSPTTGGVTASFGMLGNIIIAEPNAYIAFAGKRVIEETLKQTVPEGSQVAEYLFSKGLFDPIVPRNLLKGVLSELFQLHGFFPLNPDSKEDFKTN
uniref:Acetyl-coenzyme A carboxylase carboxyl transferase subunit beta, chloroplastic n=1 Tax=Lecanorchis japonica TaxID=915449 RepID=A0A6G7KVP2_9ASPA|nr:acetyl-CoA carboxylase subunit beta [Lecanorchis japonica]QII89409.1 acetyl-CoA carboxylase subunit beta [Lecanorchis japonica]